MKKVGIIRQVDKLGRVVIPKELREIYNINMGDPLEIFVGNDDEIILKPYFDKIDAFKNDIINQFGNNKTIDRETAKEIIVSAYEKIIKKSDF